METRLKMSPKRANVFAVVSGVLAFLAYPAFDLWPLIFVCYVPLMLALNGHGHKGRFWLGWLTGFSMIVVKHYFIAQTFVVFSGFPWPAAIAAFLVYVSYTAIGWGLFAVAYGMIRKRAPGLVGLAIVAVAYGIMERWLPFIFPFYASSALYQVPVFLQSSEWIGSTGVTALIVLFQVAIVASIERRTLGLNAFAPTVAALGLWLGLLGYGHWRMQQIADLPERTTIRTAIVQPNATIEEKRDVSLAGRALLWSRVAELTREAKTDADLIVWPEGAFPFAYQTERVRMPRNPQDNAHTLFSRRLVALAESIDQPFIASGLRAEDRRLRNSALYFAPGNSEPEVYDKRLLLWFGERIPFSDTFPSLARTFPQASNHKAGDDFVLFDIGGAKWAPNICYEALFPSFTRNALNAEEGADILLNLTNDVWFDSAQEAEHHLMVQVQRAIENRVWLVRATNSGISAFVDPAGNTHARGEVGERRVLTHDVRVTDLPRSFYRQFGDVIYYALIVLAGLWLATRRQE